MSIVGAFIVPGSPLHYLRQDNAPWKPILDGYAEARRRIDDLNPDVIAIYSTQWFAVLDQLWQTRRHLKDIHVDENWYEFGDLPFDITVDADLAEACIRKSPEIGIRSKAVDYDNFPVDSGTIVVDHLLNPEKKFPLLLTTNNLYHDWDTTEKLGAMTAEVAEAQGKRVVLIGIGGLSGFGFRRRIDIAEDRISSDAEDQANRRMLQLLESANLDAIYNYLADYVTHARVNMGFKHLAWILGGLNKRYRSAKTLGYGPDYGSGAAVIEFQV